MGDVTARRGTGDADAVDAYLDQLFDLLSGTGRAGRRFLLEAEDHLREATGAGMSRGLPPEAAAAEAVARFGTPERVAAGFAPGARRWSLRQLAGAAAVVGVLGMLAVGVSGLLTELAGNVVGPSFVAGDLPGVTYTAQRCAQFLRMEPNAGSCSAAAALDHFGETVTSRVLVGVLGLLALAVLLAVRRAAGAAAWSPPLRLVGLVGAAVAGLAGLVDLAGGGLLLMSTGTGYGAGGYLVPGGVAALCAVGFATAAYRSALRGRVTSPVR